jgi:hypothetical protein
VATSVSEEPTVSICGVEVEQFEKVTLYIGKIIGVSQCEFQHNMSVTDQLLSICQILKNKGERKE